MWLTDFHVVFNNTKSLDFLCSRGQAMNPLEPGKPRAVRGQCKHSTCLQDLMVSALAGMAVLLKGTGKGQAKPF